MGVTAANVPSFRGQASLSLGDLQDLVEVVKALMLQADAPPGRVRTGSAKAVPAHDPPEGGVYFNGKFYEKNTYFRPRPGLVQDMAFATSVTEPCFVHGHGFLPLAQTVDEAGTAHSTPVAGGVAGVRYATDSSVDAPRILPGGIIELPMFGSGVEPGVKCPLAQWGSMVASPVAGLIGGLGWVSGVDEPYADHGKIYFPLAATVDASGIDRPSAVAGAIAGIRYADTSAVDSAVGSGVGPRILPGGIIELPSPGDGLPLASWGEGQNNVPGLIQELTFDRRYEKTVASGGQIYFPYAATVDASMVERLSAVAGAIAGVRYASDSTVDAPRILPGGIIELPLPGSVGWPNGVKPLSGSAISWEALSAVAGGVEVARGNFGPSGQEVPVSLYVGYESGFLTFSLTS